MDQIHRQMDQIHRQLSKGKSTGPTVIPKPKKVCKEVRPKESRDPHICLVCGSELSRGRDFNKKRHWIQKHPDQPSENYSSKIVQRTMNLPKSSFKKMRNKPSLEVPVSKVTSGLEAKSPSSHLAVQSSLSGFVTPERNLQIESRIENMQNDLGRIILMLESLTLPENKRSPADVIVNKDISGVISPSRLLDIKHPDIIVDILEDGCRITCHTCQQFQLSQPKKNV